MKEKRKKDEYEKALSAYEQAIKEFQKGAFDKAAISLEAFIEKYGAEREIVDRARIYLEIAKKGTKKESFSLKSFEDYYHAGVFKLNQHDFPGAIKAFEKALTYKGNEPLIDYLIANAHCQMKKTDICLDFLKKAVQKDKSFGILAQNEPDFQPLWEDKKFKLITRLA